MFVCRKAYPSSYLTSPMFSVIVGEEVAGPKTFFIHSELLAKESDRLKVAVKGGFKEAEDKTIKLVDEDPGLFGYFMVSNQYLHKYHSPVSSSCVNRNFCTPTPGTR